MEENSFYSSNEYLIEQHRQSKERRRFMLFTAFDPALISILWVIFTVTQSPDWKKDFDEQCNFMNRRFFMVSLFDIVLLSVVRFLWLMTFYGFCGIKHWWAVSVTTALSSTFLLTKVVYYFLEAANQTNNPLAYAIPICSFVIAWTELYMFDAQVLPEEQRTAGNLRQRPAQVPPDANRKKVRALPVWAAGGNISDYLTATELSSESDDQHNQASTAADSIRRIKLVKNNCDIYRTYGRNEITAIGKRAMALSKHFYDSIDTWPLKKSSPLIRSTVYETYGRFFYLKVEAKVPVETLFEVLYTKSAKIPTWNPLVLENKTVMRLDDFTDVSYSISAPAMRNYIASRDFLDIRYYEQHGRIYYISTVFIRSDLRSPAVNSKIVRGENGPNLFILKPSTITENDSTFEWIMNTNLKGNLPRKLIDNSLTQFLCRFADNLEARLKLPA